MERKRKVEKEGGREGWESMEIGEKEVGRETGESEGREREDGRVGRVEMGG